MSTALSRFLPPPGPARQLVASTLVVSLGFSLYGAASALYFNRQVGLSSSQIGLGFTIAALISLPIRVPIGYLADRYGPREITAVMEVLLGLALVSLCFARSYPLFLAAIILVTIAETGSNVVFGSLISGVCGRDERVKLSAYMRSVFNGGFALGSALAGVVLAFDTRFAYLAAIGGYGVMRMLVGVTRLRLPHVAPSGASARSGPRIMALRDLPYATLGQFSSIYLMSDKILLIGLPLWLVQHTSAPRSYVAILLGVSTLIVTVFQVRATRSADTTDGAARLQSWSLGALAASCVLAASASYGRWWFACALLLSAVIALTLGEMWGAAAAWHLRYELANPAAQGQYGAVFSLGTAMPNVIGPLLVTALVNQYLFVGWAVLAALFITGALTSPVVVRWARSTRDRYFETPPAEQEQVLSEQAVTPEGGAT
ncbi:MFS transporter [Streptomyces sp. RGM 3693]|uniref:MFS transporter n=1 Tax=Streptomyces sp. RGM 3693 TaxID=3413284 RepID=UPI003D2BC1BD